MCIRDRYKSAANQRESAAADPLRPGPDHPLRLFHQTSNFVLPLTLCCLHGPRYAKRRSFIQMRGQHLHPHRQTRLRRAAGHRHPANPRQARDVYKRQDVERVAELAHLELKPEETGPMLDDLNAILDYVAELNELDTAGVAPLAQVTELLDAAGAGGPRGDVVLASLDRATVLKQAPETDQVFFKVPKVIER